MRLTADLSKPLTTAAVAAATTTKKCFENGKTNAERAEIGREEEKKLSVHWAHSILHRTLDVLLTE